MNLQNSKRLVPVIAALALVAIVPALVAAQGRPRLIAKPVWHHELADIKDRDLRVIELTLDPGAGSPPHLHPGHTVGYVIEGQFEVAINADDPIIYGPGDVFYEPKGAVHTVGRNPSETETAKVVVFMLTDRGEPITQLHDHQHN